MELCDEAILTLKGAASTMDGDKETMYSDLASANTWRHLMADVNPMSVSRVHSMFFPVIKTDLFTIVRILCCHGEPKPNGQFV